MQLLKYIHDLLYRYELVIIPGFGGLLVKPTSAYIDEKTHVFFPPSKQLGFNAQLTKNDGLLANHIASTDNIPYEAAVNLIKFELKELLQKLKNQDVFFDDIGTFSLTAESKIFFTPDVKANFSTETFGLTNFVAHTIDRGHKELKKIDVIFDSITEKVDKNVVVLKKEAPVTKVIQIHPLLKYAASVALLLSLGYVFWLKFGNNNKQTIAHTKIEQTKIQEATFEIPEELTTINLKVTVDADTDNNLNTLDTKKTESVVINNTLSNESSKNTKSVTTVDLNTNYHIIAGAFSIPNNATKKVKQLQNKGFNSHIINVTGWKLTHVAFDSYTTPSEAKMALRKIIREEAEDAWILNYPK